MGVNDLRSYIHSKKHLLRKHNFRNGQLVIDGSSLYYNLYFKSTLDQEHGGEYDDFEKVVNEFFRNLKECKIQPYVLLDGGDDFSGKKFNSLKKKAAIGIKKAQALSTGLPRNVLPILVKNMFIQLLRKLQVPFIQCVAEIHQEAAALANEWNCPVLSNDMDFYIFNIRGGLLPLCYFQWRKAVLNKKKSDKKFISARMFSVQKLCAGFSCMNADLLPIFATILGNDTNLDSGMFPNWAVFSSGAEETRYIDGLLRWLSCFEGPDDAISAVLSSVTKQKYSTVVLNALIQGLQDYKLTSSSLAQFFKKGKPQNMRPGALQCVPEWMLQPLAEGKLNSIIVDILAMQRIILSFPVENSRLSSSNLTSQPIRQVIYGLLLCTRKQHASEDDRSDAEVEEYDRQGLRLTSSRVLAVLPSQTTADLHLETLWETSWHLRLQVLLGTLQVSQVPDRLVVPPSLHLAVYVTCYWLKHSQPEPKPELFWALLINLVYGELFRDCRTQKVVPKRLKNLKCGKEKTPLDLEAAHAYSQWQSSLRDSICLSQLLNNPVPEPECAWLYSGVLVHSATRAFKKGITPESLLTGAPHALQLYQQLKEAVEHELDEDFLVRMRSREGRKDQSECSACEEHGGDLKNMFEHLMDEGEDDEGPCGKRRMSTDSSCDDEIYDKICHIRTRHKSRSRKTDPKSRKFEHSSWE